MKQTKRKKGRKPNSVVLNELGEMVINSSKIKSVFPSSLPPVLK
jgi:hypothetical protein